MTNKILKNHLKKIIKSEAFVSVIIVFVLAIGIIGTSYALYMDVDTDTDYQLVEVGDLSVGFDNGDNTFKLNYLTPTDDDIATNKVESEIGKTISESNFFSFYIYNNGNYTANYNIKLVPQEGSISSEYLRYQICKDNIENCKDINTLSETSNNIIFNDELTPNRMDSETNPSAYYFLRVWVKSDYVPNESDKVVLKVEIDAKNASGYLDNDNTLVGKLLSDDRVKINNTVPKFDNIADYVVTGDETSGELGLFKAEDDYGISYYYRGAQSYNYVNFAGFTWRVVRINGDGSIRMILDDFVRKSDGIVLQIMFNRIDEHSNAHIGYMYGQSNGGNYDAEHENKTNSLVKTEIDNFYEGYLKNYEEYLSDTLFCGDKTISEGEGYNKLVTNYSAARLNNKLPTLECAKGSNNTYSRYTANSTMTTKKILVNNDLTYSIGLLSADEVVFAGGAIGKANNNWYLKNMPTNNYQWWTMTPSFYNNGVFGFDVGNDNSLDANANLSYSAAITSNHGAVRPVINLKADVLFAGGDGTSETPYVIK